jgi:hypothetical protein
MIAPGTVLQNRYVVERRIGEGGMGAVYIATDRRFGSTVALKETFFDDPSLRRAFEREARLLNRLRHTALPRVSDHFEEGAGQFLVMEYVPGNDLSQMLKERGGVGFPPREVLGWADQLLDALDYLHTQEPQVIHRDIKPQNLKLMSRKQIVLLDFGLAKGTPLQTRVTATGSVFGYSFNYAPIEQMQGAGTDPRSDLYSLGATLYHLLTGATPPDALTRATAVLNGEPDPLRPANEGDAARVSPELADALTHAMALSAGRRFESAGEMRDALRESVRGLVEEKEESGAGAAATTAFESEQKTRLMDADGAARTSQDAPRTKATNVISTPDAATLVNTDSVAGAAASVAGAAAATAQGLGAAATSAQGHSAPQTSAQGVGSTSEQALDDASGHRLEVKSVVTRVRVEGAAHGARGSRRALGAAAGVVVLALVAVAVYSLTRRAATDAPAEQPAPQASVQPATQTPTHAGAQTTEAAPSPASQSAPSAAQPRHTLATTARNTKTPEENRNAQGAHDAHDAHDTTPPTPPAPVETTTDADSPFRGRDLVNNPLTDEEVRRWAAQHPKRARQAMRRMMEERRRRGLPTPP